MPLSENEQWISVRRLEEAEQEEIRKVETGCGAEAVGDSGAYYALLKGKSADWVRTHGMTRREHAAFYVRQIKALLDKARNFQVGPRSILDVGCGVGVITEALRALSDGGPVTGIDVSESDIACAVKSYPLCRFAAVGVDESLRLPEKYDLIHAREFYPFTRTGDLDFHKGVIGALARHIKPGGCLLISLTDKKRSLADNADALDAWLPEIGLSPFLRRPLAAMSLSDKLPLPLAVPITLAAKKIMGRDAAWFYLSRSAGR